MKLAKKIKKDLAALFKDCFFILIFCGNIKNIKIMTRQLIASLIKKNILALQREGIFPRFSVSEILVSRAANSQFGDFTTSLAMKLVGQLRKNPIEIANLIKSQMESDKIASKIFKRIEVAGPGFINFYLADSYFQRRIAAILKLGKKFGSNNFGRNKKVQVEFISANPTGPLHLGNGRGGAIGNALANILEFSGYKVEKEYYINDRGNQIRMLGVSTSAGKEFAQKNRLEENIYQGEYIRQWEEKNKKLVERYKNNLEELGRRMAKDFLDKMIKPAVKKFGIKFDRWFSEKSLYNNGTVGKILEFLKDKNLVYMRDNALWFRAKNFGDAEDRVLIKSDGETTYFLSDLAYHWNKFAVRKFRLVIDVWGADHYGYLTRVKAGLQALKIPEDKLTVIVMQLVRLIENGREIKMSKRAGTYVTLDELIDEVGADVAKFFFLMSSPESHMDFDLALAKERSEKNPVYYVQYAHARLCAILRKCDKSKIQNSKFKNFNLLNHSSELALIKALDYFPELVYDIAQNYEAHRLTHYAIGLAKLFHAFYRDCRVIGEKRELFETRLALVLATQIVLKNLLDLIGVSAPEKM